ncbi:hypothetical protein IMG5_089160 [Ichthyophthirius multifiliis]|uniref:Importin N-terminal domain-containing protein n=1 Tax=Ichthyophthirius multifiliis TaxID=5932 RepID=G0QR62_ICHMU|nr:hypothetical protein IMG5_089160 [Ichthyophthirius multifiliis]EGR32294.1 hypothetical protein IMG5_089160 [Ichthyophthirius multifiliis]|eukprot:XP_004035780.1 hypothetical protein IMG5_089160 [Ichthyophthirius multifiliis]
MEDTSTEQNTLIILNIYQQLLQNPSILAQGQKYLEDSLQNINNFASISAKIFVSNNQDQQTRIYIGALLKNLLKENWENNQYLAKQKKDIREIFLNGIIMNVGSLRIVEMIALIITEIILYDGVELWANPLKEIIQWISNEEMKVVDTGLELFCTIFSKVNQKYNSEKLLPEKFSFTLIIPELMPSLFHIFARPEVKINIKIYIYIYIQYIQYIYIYINIYIYISIQLTEKQREKLMVLLYLTVSQFAYADDVNNQLVSQCFDDTYEAWMNLFISALKTNPKTHINMKRYILKILTVIYRDFTYYSRKSIAQRLQPIWKFFNSILPLYIWTNVYGVPLNQLDDNLQPLKDPLEFQKDPKQQYGQQKNNEGENLEMRFLEEEDEYLNEIEGLTINCIELVSTLVTKDTLYMLIKLAVFPIINALSHFILLTKDQERQWVYEPNQFVSDDEDEQNMRSIRNLALQLIFQLIDKFGDITIQALMIVAEKFMMNFDEAHSTQIIKSQFEKMGTKEIKLNDFNNEKLMEFVKTSNFDCGLDEHAWKKKEIGLLLLGNFSDDIIDFQYKHSSSFNINTLIKNLIVDIDNQNTISILVAKSIWCVSRFSEIIASKNNELFLPLFKVCTERISSRNEFPVRLTATKAIGMFAHKINTYKQQLVIDKNQLLQYGVGNANILYDIFDILNNVNEETIHIVLDTLVYLNKLSPVYAPEIANIGSRKILQVFTLQHADVLVSKITLELITQLAENAQSFMIIFSSISPFILDSFQLFQNHILVNSDLSQIRQYDITLMASIFDVTSIFVKNCIDNKAKESLITLLPPLMNLMAVNEESVLQQHASICLKNFLKVADQFILKNGLIQDVMKVIMKLLQVSQNSQLESASTYAGNLCMIAFNNLLGGSADPEILRQIVYKVFRSKLATTVQGLVLVWARMINNNPIESVNFLCSFSIENRLGLKALIDKWLLQQPVFRGKYTKNTTFLALSKLFLLKDKRIENLIAIAYNPSHQNIGNDVSAPFKILSTLIRGLDNEMAPLRKDQENNKKEEENLQVENDDDDDVYNGENMEFKDGNEEKIEVDLNVIQDEEEADIEKRFAIGDKKGGGLGEFEIGSTNYMTDGFAFGYDDGEECDETTEEDLLYLNDPVISYNTADLLKNIFNELSKSDPKYFAECLKNLLKEDIALLQKYVIIKNIDTLLQNQS